MAKHEKTFVDFDKPYEQNLIGMKGIIVFALGLFLLIVITFGLMWALMNVMEGDAVVSKGSKEPLAMTEEEKLPPEPRLQSAPGFGINGEKGRVNLELREPQAEYRELRKIWETNWMEGQKDLKTGTVISLPIDEAKKKFLEQSAQMKTDENGAKIYEESRHIISYSSSGRTATDKIR
ncbi:MAG TPA: hypothetical protein VGC76_17615 [Pyrinomonadaceae bacterium]|jgi:hypothetical protein